MCIFVLEKPEQHPDMHVPPDGTGTATRQLVGISY